MENYYETLSVDPKATQAEIKERFRFLANAYHPDKFPSETHKVEAEAEFKKINEAYQVLSIPSNRAEYDRKLGLAKYSGGENGRSGPTTARPVNPSDVASFGRQAIRFIISLVVLSFLANYAAKMGPVGIILVLVLVGIVYFKFFMR